LLPVAFGLFLVVAVVNGIFAGSLALVPIGVAVSVIAATLYQGTVVGLVRDVQDGRRAPITALAAATIYLRLLALKGDAVAPEAPLPPAPPVPPAGAASI
jgi:hypothetical protein